MRAAVIGGGLGGCAAALALLRTGADVTVFEAADAMRREGESISLLANGTSALAALGIDEPFGQRISRITVLGRRRGGPIGYMDMAEIERRTGHPYVVVPRVELLELLSGRLGERVVYGKRCESVVTNGAGAEISFADGTLESADLVVAADGSRSTVRQELWPGDESAPFSTAWQGTVALPEGYGSADEVFLVMAPRTVVGTFPTTGGRVLFFIEDSSEPAEERSRVDRDELRRRFSGWPGPIHSLIDAVGADAIRTDEVFIRQPPRQWSRGSVFLLGDAAHTLSPSVGQGTNQAFEDAVALATALTQEVDLAAAGRRYTRSRSIRAMAYWHFSKLAAHPVVATVNELNQRLMPESTTTKVWLRVTRPSALVRRALAGR